MTETPNKSNVLNEFQPANKITGDNPLIIKGTLEIQDASTYKIAGEEVLNKSTLTDRLNNLSAPASLTDFVKMLGIKDIISLSAGTWTITRIAQADYVYRKTAGDNTTVIGIDITEILRTTALKGFKLASFDLIFRNNTADLDAHSVVLDKIVYVNSVAPAITSVPLTGSLPVGQDADPQVSNITITTPAFLIDDNAKYVMELTVDAGATSAYDFIGVMLKFTQNNL